MKIKSASLRLSLFLFIVNTGFCWLHKQIWFPSLYCSLIFNSVLMVIPKSGGISFISETFCTTSLTQSRGNFFILCLFIACGQNLSQFWLLLPLIRVCSLSFLLFQTTAWAFLLLPKALLREHWSFFWCLHCVSRHLYVTFSSELHKGIFWYKGTTYQTNSQFLRFMTCHTADALFGKWVYSLVLLPLRVSILSLSVTEE